MSDNRISSSQPSYTSSLQPSASEVTSASGAAPMSKAAEAAPDAAAAFFSKDEVTRDEQGEKELFYQQATSAKPRQKANLAESTPVRDLQAMQAPSRKASMPAESREQLDELAARLGNAEVFDLATCRPGGQIGTQLNASFFDGRSGDVYAAVRDMLEHPGETRTALHAALAHIPASERGQAVDTIMDKLANKLCERIQQDMSKQVNFAINVAQAEIAPFCQKDPGARHALMSALLHSDASKSEVRASLESVGIDPSDSEDIAERILDVRANKEQMAAFDDAIKHGDFGSEHWDSGTIYDGDLLNLEQAIHDAFDTMHDNMESVREQLSNDRPRGDASFVNPLFEKAFLNACANEGIDLKHSKVGKMLEERIETRKARDTAEAHVSNGILIITSAVAPGSGVITGALTGGLSTSNQQQALRAARGGARLGLVEQSYVDGQKSKRNYEAGSAIFGIIAGKATGKMFEGASPGRFTDWKSTANIFVDIGIGTDQYAVGTQVGK